MKHPLQLAIFLAILIIADCQLTYQLSVEPVILIPVYLPPQTVFAEEGHWGDWTDQISIDNYFICGAEMRFENPVGKGKRKDDTATNGFRWRFCNYQNWNDQQQREFEGLWGEWKGMVMCPQGYYVNGFQARIEGRKLTIDDTAMNGLQINCIKPKSSNLPLIKTVYDGVWGDWKGWQIANDGYLFYAVLMRFEGNQGSGDDTAMNGVMFKAKLF